MQNASVRYKSVMRTVRPPFLYAALLALAGTAIVASDEPQIPDESRFWVRDVFKKPGYPEVKIVGVCDISFDRTDCWDTAGRRFSELSQRITAYYKEKKYSTLTVRPGVKNRWVVIERETSESLADIQFSVSMARYAGGIDSSFRSGYALEWVRLDKLKEDTTTDLVTNFGRSLPAIALEVKSGARANIGGLSIEIENFGRKKPARMWDADYSWGGEFQFAIYARCKVMRDLDQRFTSILAIDKKGQPVNLVDNAGKPVSGSDSQSTGAKSVQFLTTGAIPTEVEFITNVDPAYLSQLKISHRQEEQVIFQNIPLDPVSAS